MDKTNSKISPLFLGLDITEESQERTPDFEGIQVSL